MLGGYAWNDWVHITGIYSLESMIYIITVDIYSVAILNVVIEYSPHQSDDLSNRISLK